MDTDVDLIILGGGCSGLSLAMRLAELGPECPRTVMIERRAAYANDRTWCFWDDGSPRIRPLVRHQWQAVRVRAGRQSVTVDCGARPYQMLQADTFYDDAIARVARNDRIRLVLNTPVAASPDKRAGRWRVETSKAAYSAGVVVDTRPVRSAVRGAALLCQSF
jgi:lycopene beta-cyclase